MELHPPLMISARLLPAVRIGDTFISIEPTCTRDHSGKPLWRYFIDGPHLIHEGEDLAGWDDSRGMLGSLLSFLSACAESYPDGECADLFPANVAEWAQENSDEISIISLELDCGGDPYCRRVGCPTCDDQYGHPNDLPEVCGE